MALLILNSIPYFLNDRQITAESSSVANIVQQNDRPYDSPVISSAEVSRQITIEWLAGEKAQPEELALERTCRAIIEASIVLLAQQKYLDAEKQSIKVPFTNIPMPDKIQATCGYIGKTMSILGGYVESFSASWDMSGNKIIWNISIGVIDLKAKRQPEEPAKNLAGAGSEEQATGIVLKYTGDAVQLGV